MRSVPHPLRTTERPAQAGGPRRSPRLSAALKFLAKYSPELICVASGIGSVLAALYLHVSLF
jgi:hypothetical protein